MTVMQRETDSAPRKVRASRTRWWIVWTLFFSTVTNYISRQTFSVLAPMLASQYHFSHSDLARILGAFQISYAITWLLGGIFLDAVGTRLGLALAVAALHVWFEGAPFAGAASGPASGREVLLRALASAEGKAGDLQFLMRGPVPPASELRVVAIDEKSVQRHGRDRRPDRRPDGSRRDRRRHRRGPGTRSFRRPGPSRCLRRPGPSRRFRRPGHSCRFRRPGHSCHLDHFRRSRRSRRER